LKNVGESELRAIRIENLKVSQRRNAHGRPLSGILSGWSKITGQFSSVGATFERPFEIILFV
jgi:hypothetical protein